MNPDLAKQGRDATGLALRYLTFKDRTEYEIRAYLERKGFSQTHVRRTLERLRRWGYVNDKHVALHWARDRLERADWGPARLVRELGKRGLDAGMIEWVLEEVTAEIDEEDMARKAAARYLRTHPGTEGPKGMRRLAGFLGRRGYSGEVIGRILRDWKLASIDGEHLTIP